MSDTPLTDEQVLAYLTEDGSELVHASTARELETELAAMKAEFEKVTLLAAQTADRNVELRRRAEKAEAKLAEMSSIAEKWEDDALRYARNAEYWQSRAEKAEAECLEQARLLGVSGSREAALLSEIEQLEIELARLYTDLERFTGHGLLDCHQICDQRDAAVAELAAEREKVRVLRDALELITNQADACKAFCDTFTPSSRIKARAALDDLEALAATKESIK